MWIPDDFAVPAGPHFLMEPTLFCNMVVRAMEVMVYYTHVPDWGIDTSYVPLGDHYPPDGMQGPQGNWKEQDTRWEVCQMTPYYNLRLLCGEVVQPIDTSTYRIQSVGLVKMYGGKTPTLKAAEWWISVGFKYVAANKTMDAFIADVRDSFLTESKKYRAQSIDLAALGAQARQDMSEDEIAKLLYP